MSVRLDGCERERGSKQTAAVIDGVDASFARCLALAHTTNDRQIHLGIDHG